MDAPRSIPSVPRLGIPRALKQWDRYEVLEILGAGGMGAVYKARDLRLNRFVALKVVHPMLGHAAETKGEFFIRRFMREARIQASIDHPHICKVYEIGELPAKEEGEAGFPYITMQLITGKPLHQAQADMSLFEKVQVIQQVAEALHAAHRQGLIHRDIKPSNIMVERTADGRFHPYVMDFGLARDVEGSEHTRSGVIEGTPRFMSPEQARGETKTLDRRSDVYSLGITLYEILVGQSPYQGTGDMDILLAVLSADPKPLRAVNANIPIDLEAITLKCLEKEPASRYDSAKALADDLMRYLDGEPVQARYIGVGRRLFRRARKHKALVALGVALGLTLIGVGIYGLRVRVLAQQAELRAKRQAELAQQLGQEIKDMEWVMRSARQMPLHDLTREKIIVRKRIEQLKQDLQNQGELTRGLVHYALGRGHLALQEYDQAHEHLQLAIKNGQSSAAVYHALGLVGGKVFRKALRYSMLDGGSQGNRLKMLTPKYLTPTIEALKRSREMKLDAPAYLEGLIAFYQEDYQAALKHAADTIQQAPWLYEAHRLAGDAHRELAQQRGKKGEYKEAEQESAAARKSYEAAAAIGQSDGEVYYDMGVSMKGEIDRELARGINNEATNAAALSVAEKAITVEPDNPDAYWLKASIAILGLNGDENAGRASAFKQMDNCMSATSAALKLAPEDAFVHLGMAVCFLSSAQLQKAPAKAEEFFQKAADSMKWVADRHPKFFIGQANLVEMYAKLALHQQLRGGPEAKANLERARAYSVKAEAIFPGILETTLYTLLAFEGQVVSSQSKQELETLVAQAEALFASAKKENDKTPTLYAGGGAVYTRAAWRLFLAGEDAQALTQRALETLAAGRKLGGFLMTLEQDSALVQLLDANLRVRSGQDPAPALAEVEASLKRCFDKLPENVRCRTMAAQAALLQSDWLAQNERTSSRARDNALALALEKVTLATQSPEYHPDVFWVLAETHLRLAQAQPKRAAIVEQNLAAGLAATEKLFALNPNHAPGRATLGRLLLLRAQGQRDPQTRHATAKSAALAFEQAQKLDPMLAKSYAPLLTQANAATAD